MGRYSGRIQVQGNCGLTDMKPTGVMHVIDSLEVGGAERMAVHSANHLCQRQYRPFLCITRQAGPLLDDVQRDVRVLVLGRRHTFDPFALSRMCSFIRDNGIEILHAHSTSLFLALAASRFSPHPAVVWHMHYGGAAGSKYEPMFGFAARRTAATIAVTSNLREWAARSLRVPDARLFYIPNFAAPFHAPSPCRDLPGSAGSRIVCVGNFRREKDQLNLVSAMRTVAEVNDSAHLIIVGAANDAQYARAVQQQISESGLASRVTILGRRLDVPQILAACDIGVLSSAVEGLPVALIEYGSAGLPVVATRVGQCEEVLDEGTAGILVAPREPRALAIALLELLNSPERRDALAANLKRRVDEHYSADTVVAQFSNVYKAVLSQN